MPIIADGPIGYRTIDLDPSQYTAYFEPGKTDFTLHLDPKTKRIKNGSSIVHEWGTPSGHTIKGTQRIDYDAKTAQAVLEEYHAYLEEQRRINSPEHKKRQEDALNSAKERLASVMKSRFENDTGPVPIVDGTGHIVANRGSSMSSQIGVPPIRSGISSSTQVAPTRPTVVSQPYLKGQPSHSNAEREAMEQGADGSPRRSGGMDFSRVKAFLDAQSSSATSPDASAAFAAADGTETALSPGEVATLSGSSGSSATSPAPSAGGESAGADFARDFDYGALQAQISDALSDIGTREALDEALSALPQDAATSAPAPAPAPPAEVPVASAVESGPDADSAPLEFSDDGNVIDSSVPSSAAQEQFDKDLNDWIFGG